MSLHEVAAGTSNALVGGMKKPSRKLNLNRETLAPLQSDELSNVNGGALPTKTTSTLTTLTITSKLCKSLIIRATE